MRYVVWKEKKEFAVDLKEIYHAPTVEAAEQALENFEKKWDDLKLFINYGMLTEEKFWDKAKDFALMKNMPLFCFRHA